MCPRVMPQKTNKKQQQPHMYVHTVHTNIAIYVYTIPCKSNIFVVFICCADNNISCIIRLSLGNTVGLRCKWSQNFPKSANHNV